MDFDDERDNAPIEEDENDSSKENDEMEIQIETAPLLTFLKAPPRPTLLRPFKMPEGAVAIDPTASQRFQLGGRRRVKMLIPGGFKRHSMLPQALSLGPTPSELALIAEKAAEEEAARLTLEAEAENAAAMGRISNALPTKLPDGYEPLILHLASLDNSSNSSSSSALTAEDKVEDEMTDDVSAVIEGEIIKTKLIERDVIVEDVMGVHLRQHQREGVSFLFDCIHGKKGRGINGAILADDMGLGKTLQSIALLYTCLRQGIYRDRPTAKRAIVVCPTSLVNNWAAEIKKWLGERIRPLALAEVSRDEAVRDITAFLTSNVFPVLIISYETFRIHADRFHASEGSCDLLICDEAHRLKNEATLTTQALGKLKCLRRILLSGTPMQNDLDEFFAMVDFSNPGILGDVSNFRRKFAVPILTGREPSATDKQQRSGEEASNELSSIVNKFILRRTNALLSQHLPPKLLQVVCVKMTDVQRNIYMSFLNSVAVANVVSGTKGKGVLGSILALKK
jgi:SNF2 family DNA or RNA helicase